MAAKRGKPTQWIYRLRKDGALSVPPEIATQIPDGSFFHLKIVPEGLLYEFVTEVKTEPVVTVPWLGKES